MALNIHIKGFTILKTISDGKSEKVKNLKHFLSAKKTAIISCRFGRTAQFWLPLVLGEAAVCKETFACKNIILQLNFIILG